jgi:hypothetical protein
MQLLTNTKLNNIRNITYLQNIQYSQNTDLNKTWKTHLQSALRQRKVFLFSFYNFINQK